MLTNSECTCNAAYKNALIFFLWCAKIDVKVYGRFVYNMHFENFETVEYKRSSILFEGVFQARFPDIMRIQHEAPIAFQEAIITEGYTETLSGLQYSVSEIPNQIQEQNKAFNFFTEQKDWEVVLSRGYISLHCHRNYKDYSDFKDKLGKVLQIFHKIYTPPYFTRLGLMYRNMANRVFLPHLQDLNISIESFIPEHIFPILATPMADDVLSLQTFSQFDDQEIKATSNHYLSKVSGLYGQRQMTNEQSYVIDIDCFYDRNVGEINDILTKCDVFKQLEWNIFQWSITDALREAMEKYQS